MNYKIVNITPSANRGKSASVLIIYTGGTFGMDYDDSGSLVPYNFGRIVEHVPTLQKMGVNITVISSPEPIDSSNISIKNWKDIAYIIEENYDSYEGFVVLHGTDTMAYSASALSYMLQGLTKPVIFTGAQLPIGAIRSDARSNLITSVEIASTYQKGIPTVPEVCVYFNSYLLRGCRSRKIKSSQFAAFESENYPLLAEAGIFLEYNHAAIAPFDKEAKLQINNNFDKNVAILKLFPNINESVISSILNTQGLRGVVLETYGSGNAPTDSWFLDLIKYAIDRDILIFNVSQCVGGKVEQGRYETSRTLQNIGIVGGSDITTEAAITKLMFLLGQNETLDTIKERLGQPICGEMGID